MTALWRLNIKPDAQEGVDPVRFCLDKQILGVGWPVDSDSPLDWKTYCRLGQSNYRGRWQKGWRAATNAIHDRMKTNDLCWTRDPHGNYYLGRITGNWEYRSARRYREADIVNVRLCRWFPTGGVDSVPGKVLNSFRPNRTVQAVYDETASFYSRLKYNQLIGKAVYDLSSDEELDLFSLISPEDCEDIVGIYLQEEHGYRLIPSSRKRDTVWTEFVLKKGNGKQAYVQVKQGNVDLNKDNFKYDAGNPCEWFLFTTNGHYTGRRHNHIHCLKPNDMHEFALAHRNLMSDRVQTFIDFCNSKDLSG